MGFETREKREAHRRWGIEREAKIVDADLSMWKRLLAQEGIPTVFDGLIETDWFSAPNIKGKSVSVRLRRLAERGKEKIRHTWAIKVRISKRGDAKHIRESDELEGETKKRKHAKNKLRKNMSRVYPNTTPKQFSSLEKIRRVLKERVSFRLEEPGHPLHGVQFDCDVIVAVNGKKLSQPISILEIEADSEIRIFAAAKHFGISPDNLSSIPSSTLLKERGYLP